MRELPAGPDAVLLDFATDRAPLRSVASASAALRRAVQAGNLNATELIPTAQTLLVQADRGRGVDVLGIHRALRAAATGDDTDDATTSEIRIPVTYDGPDLADVAGLLDLGTDEVAAIHRDTTWQVQFMGFAPGFGYLVPQQNSPHPFRDIGRRSESRTRVPAGAVAIAAGYSAVYPRASPGGWHLIGHTDRSMWDEDNTPPAVLEPGSLVHFVDAGDGSRGPRP
ncbi:5-oxoprolinase subunit B family protein [Gordonia hankookensis]|uniref:Carboxyltransferase domain-containing protein n=1 Tax=Gordonia hankookensis TaxID=589403 RepID=A0ABR7WF32_9ACTN|nr:carboxyltransferase domain-containing protein [Gordonia hankookensis]MBD1321394.1 carboxyltransferase domain-containing protein [Gordonia hankookensis]